MMRLAALTSCLLLSCFVVACDKGDDGDTNGDDETTGPEPQPCGTEWVEKDAGSTPSIMDAWGAPCTSDDECVAILGTDGVCVENILGVYDLPGGFCSKYCDLPDSSTSFIHDAEQCDPNGGVTCVGAKDLFSACIIPCTDNNECGREGYGCRAMPTLASEGDPTFCLMSTVDCCTTDDGQCAP
jgi:hypothetical protein